MKIGLFFFLLSILTLIIVFSRETQEHSIFVTDSTCRSVDINNINTCVVSQISFTLKKDLPSIIRFRPFIEKYHVKESNPRLNNSQAFLKLYLSKTADCEVVKKKPLQLILYTTADNPDEYHS